MSYRYRKHKNERRRRSERPSWVRIIIVIFVAIAAVGLLANLFDFSFDFNFNDNKKETVTVYLVPGDDWSSDGSSYGVWCWNNSGVPEGCFVLGADTDEDGIYEFKVSTDYSRMLFVDLNPETTELGDDWKNKRAQTDNLAIPSDKNVYYHQYANEWTDNADILFTVTTSEVTVYIDACNFACLKAPVLYYFDKTGKNEPNFVNTVNVAGQNAVYTATVPAGYTHIVFIDYSEDGAIGSWDNILNQTDDLIIPTGNENMYSTAFNSYISFDSISQ